MSVIDSVAVIRARVVQIVVSENDAAVHLGREVGALNWTTSPAVADAATPSPRPGPTFMVPMTPAQAQSLRPDEVLELIVRRAAQ